MTINLLQQSFQLQNKWNHLKTFCNLSLSTATLSTFGTSHLYLCRSTLTTIWVHAGNGVVFYLGLTVSWLNQCFYANSHSSAVLSFFFRLVRECLWKCKSQFGGGNRVLVLSNGKYGSYCLNGGRLERREAGEANLEVGFHPQPVPLWSFCLCWSLQR